MAIFPSSPSSNGRGNVPMAVTLFYLITGGLWILFSDRLLSLFVSAPPVLTFMQTIKGWFYVAITGGLLYVILRRWALEQERSLLLERSLRSIDDALIREKSLEEILGAVCDTVIGIGYPMCWLGLVEPDLAVRPVACRGLAPAALDRLQVSWEEVSSRRISRGTVNGTDEYLVYQDLQESGGHAPWLEEVRRLGYRSCASLPLRIHGRVLGVLNVGHRKRGAFSPHRLHTLMTIAQQATTVLYSARRREAFERLDYQHRLILNSVGDGILGVNREGIITFANRAVMEITRYDFNELFGQDLYEFLHPLKWNGTPCPREECKIFSAIKNGEVAREDDGLFWKKDGTALPVEVTTAPIAEGDEVNGAVVVFKDISERKRYERQLAYLANHDPLTGLYNRYRFEEEVSAILSRMRSRGISGAMFFLDVDGFRSLNETLGHRAGDEIIVALAGVLKGMLHPGDILARPGSDEFVIFIIDEGHTRAGELASDILDAVRQNVITVKGQLVGVTVSIGLAFFPEHGLSVEDLLSRAEMAMYRAKEKGRNQFYIFRPDETILQGVEHRLSWEKHPPGFRAGSLFTVFSTHTGPAPGGNPQLRGATAPAGRKGGNHPARCLSGYCRALWFDLRYRPLGGEACHPTYSFVAGAG